MLCKRNYTIRIYKRKHTHKRIKKKRQISVNTHAVTVKFLELTISKRAKNFKINFIHLIDINKYQHI